MTSNGIREPSFEIDSALELRLPPPLTSDREEALEALDILHARLLGPLPYFMTIMSPAVNIFTSLNAIYYFGIAQALGLREEIPYGELASRVNVDTSDIRRFLRLAIAYRIFQEPHKNVVAHSAMSRLLVDIPAFNDWIGLVTREMHTASMFCVDAMIKWPGSSDPAQTGFSLARGTESSFFSEMGKHPARASRFANGMTFNSTMPALSPSRLADNLPWTAYSCPKVIVDVAGSQGIVGQELLSKYSGIEQYIVQDSPAVINETLLKVDTHHKISFQSYDFFTEQPNKAADVYLLRLVLHDWPDSKALEILPNQAVAMKSGARLILNEICLPDPGGSISHREQFVSADNIRAIYGSQSDQYDVESFRLSGMRPFCGEGLLTTDGSVWERSRTMIKPTFHKNNLSDLSGFKRSFDQLLSRIPPDGSTIDSQPLLSLMFVDTSTLFLLGHPLGVLGGNAPSSAPVDGQTFLKAWQMSLRSCSIRNSLGLLKFIVPRSESVKQWRIVHDLVDFHIDRAIKGQTHNTQDQHRSLLDIPLQQTKNKMEIRNQIIQGMMASQDTTSILISNIIFLLSRNPAVWQQLRADTASIDLTMFGIEDMRKCKSLSNVLHESLRIFPIFPTLARVSLKDSILPTGGGVHGDRPVFVAAGTRTLSNFYALHRGQDVWGKNVEEFDPSRWHRLQPGPWQFMGFGGGQRACLGQQKALMEASYALIKFGKTFERLESRDGSDWAGEQKLTAKNVHDYGTK
ncbi:MAG: hypothetical protein Q9222_002649 [Ikaeria aurantiellina]